MEGEGREGELGGEGEGWRCNGSFFLCRCFLYWCEGGKGGYYYLGVMGRNGDCLLT